MTTRNPLAAALAAALLAACGTEADLATSAQALDATACQAEVSTLRAQTLLARFSAARDQAGLVGKLDDASTKIAQGKYADAVQKLSDYQLKVQALVAQGKIRPSLDGAVTPQLLLDGAAAAIACLTPPPPPDPAPATSGI